MNLVEKQLELVHRTKPVEHLETDRVHIVLAQIKHLITRSGHACWRTLRKSRKLSQERADEFSLPADRRLQRNTESSGQWRPFHAKAERCANAKRRVHVRGCRQM